MIISFHIPQNFDDFQNVPINVIDISQLKKQQDKILHQANYDALTGLANRNLFSDRLGQSIAIAKRNNESFALLFLDLDGFKHVNDSLGHEMGDYLLTEAAQRIQRCIRESDTVARLGGDEFALLLPTPKINSQVQVIVKKILSTLNIPYQLAHHTMHISACIGIANFPNDGCDESTLLRKADSAMYKAKAKGANNFQYFTQEMDKAIVKRTRIEQALRKAIRQNELSVFYQPIINLSDNKVHHAEALIRWHSETLGPVMPDDFISIAEETGLINDIGQFVLEESCQQAAYWQNSLASSPGVAVNVSSQQFLHEDMAEKVKLALTKAQLPAEKLTIEITESLLIKDDSSIITQLNNIRALGVFISIDDFGTGYSSLSYLKRFPVTNLKIDRSFISNLPNDVENVALVKTILSMAQTLNIAVIAEGVEEQAQEQYLQQHLCQFAQGYYYSKPLNRDDFNHWLTDKISHCTKEQV